MNTMMKLALASGAAFLISVSIQAHEPEEHMKEAQSPDCAAMADMDHNKMDMDDPVMAAMMKQCMAHTEAAANAAGDGEHGHTENHEVHSHEMATPVNAAVAEEAHQH